MSAMPPGCRVRRLWRVAVACFALLAGTAGLWPACATQRTPVPFADTAQVKWTSIGAQATPLATLVFTVRGQAVEPERFAPHQQPNGRPEVHNRLDVEHIELPVEVMRRLLVTLYTTDLSGTVGDELVSQVVVWEDQQGRTGAETMFNRADFERMFPAVSRTLGTYGEDALRRWGCLLALFPTSMPC